MESSLKSERLNWSWNSVPFPPNRMRWRMIVYQESWSSNFSGGIPYDFEICNIVHLISVNLYRETRGRYQCLLWNFVAFGSPICCNGGLYVKITLGLEWRVKLSAIYNLFVVCFHCLFFFFATFLPKELPITKFH